MEFTLNRYTLADTTPHYVFTESIFKFSTPKLGFLPQLSWLTVHTVMQGAIPETTQPVPMLDPAVLPARHPCLTDPSCFCICLCIRTNHMCADDAHSLSWQLPATLQIIILFCFCCKFGYLCKMKQLYPHTLME